MRAKLNGLKALALAIALYMLVGLSGCGQDWESAENLGRNAGRTIDQTTAQIEKAYDDLGEPNDGPAEKLGAVLDHSVIAFLYFRPLPHF